jgi:hypothetical protein
MEPPYNAIKQAGMRVHGQWAIGCDEGTVHNVTDVSAPSHAFPCYVRTQLVNLHHDMKRSIETLALHKYVLHCRTLPFVHLERSVQHCLHVQVVLPLSSFSCHYDIISHSQLTHKREHLLAKLYFSVADITFADRNCERKDAAYIAADVCQSLQLFNYPGM